MAINLVRKPSETPNVNNYDDYRMYRYATGGYNGIVKDFGNECGYESVAGNFKITSGEIVIDGVQARIDASGLTINIDNVSGTEYYSVYCEINLTLIDNQKVEIKSIKSTADYPVIEKGDDLTENQTGVSRLELYKLQVDNGSIVNVEKTAKVIEYGKSKMSEVSKISQYASDDFSQGTIEERLTNLGFKEGSIINVEPIFLSYGTVQKNQVLRQGNYVLLNFEWKALGTFPPAFQYIGRVSNDFKVSDKKIIGKCVINGFSSSGQSVVFAPDLFLKSDNSLVIESDVSGGYLVSLTINCGYEASPIN